MFKNIILIACLIIISKSDKDLYLPMEKTSKYGDDVCRYFDDGHYYVKPCEKGKYCAERLSSDTSYLEICHDLPNQSLLSNLNEGKCKTSLECEVGLSCNGNTCTKCPTNYAPSGEYPNYQCRDNSYIGNGFCKSVTLDSSNNRITKYSYPESYKKCGKLTIKEYPNLTGRTYTGIYYTALDEYTYIGTVPDGEYVDDMELCESGFALAFYYGGNYESPRSDLADAPDTNTPYLRCVTPISINYAHTGNCSITYKIKDEEPLNYNVDKIRGWTLYNDMINLCDEEYIKIKSDNFREYSKSISENERETCGDLEDTNKYTCQNNNLIKSWYFYKNPEKYILYHDREKLDKVLQYLIQKDYPSYSSSKFLNLKILFLLLLFII
jgi:hypothetical protein